LELGASWDWAQWHEVRVSLTLEGGTNFITTSFGEGDVGSLNLDSVAISTLT
jgi:hypothetical protein